MKRDERNKYLIMVDAATETNGGQIGGTVTTSNVLDTLGCDEWTIMVIASTAATNKKPTTLKLGECDTTVKSSFSDIVAFTGGTATSTSVGFVIPVPEGTESDSTYKPYHIFSVDARGKKRYLDITIVPTTTQTYTVVAYGNKAGEMPDTTTEMNVRAIAVG